MYRFSKNQIKILALIFLVTIIAGGVYLYISEPDYKSTDVVLSEIEKDWISKNKIIKTACNPQYAPIEFMNPNQKMEGITKDYYDLFEDKLGITFEAVPTNSWKDALKKGINKEVDIVASMAPSSKRAEFFNFSEVYISLELFLVTRKNEKSIVSMGTIVKGVVGLNEDFESSTYFLANYPSLTVKMFKNDEASLFALSSGKVDAVFCDLASLNSLIHKKNLPNLKVVEFSGVNRDLCFGIDKNNKILHQLIYKAYNSITNQQKNGILNKWLPLEFQQYYSLQKKLIVLCIFGFSLISFVFTLLFLNFKLKKRLHNHRADVFYVKDTIQFQLQNKMDYFETLKKQLEEHLGPKEPALIAISTEMNRIHLCLNKISELFVDESNHNINSKKTTIFDEIRKSDQINYNILLSLLNCSKNCEINVPLNYELIDLKELIDGVISSIDADLAKKKVKVKYYSSVTKIMSDRGRIELILRNILQNAVKFSPKNSEVEISSNLKSNQIEILVSDQGKGISKEKVDAIFKNQRNITQTETTKEIGKGLGLSISLEFVKELGGKLEFESTGYGTITKITLKK